MYLPQGIVKFRDGKDQGTNVRERAKQLVSLLQDEDRLRGEREKGLKNKERFSKATTGIGSHSGSQIGYTATGVGTSTGLGASSARDAIRVRYKTLHLSVFTFIRISICLMTKKESKRYNKVAYKAVLIPI